MHNGLKYVLYDDEYSYDEAERKCVDEGGTLAMAADNDTFNVLADMIQVYSLRPRNSYSAFIDGSYDTASDAWRCVNTQGSTCPATMPWQPGQPDDPSNQRCVAVMWSYDEGIGDIECFHKTVVICQFTM